MGSFIRIGLGIEEGESSLCGGAPRAVIPGGILKCRDPACTHPKTYLNTTLSTFCVCYHSPPLGQVEKFRDPDAPVAAPDAPPLLRGESLKGKLSTKLLLIPP